MCSDIGHIGSLHIGQVSGQSGFPGGHMTLDATASSQFVSAVLICAPYARRPVRLTLVGSVVSRPYIQVIEFLLFPTRAQTKGEIFLSHNKR